MKEKRLTKPLWRGFVSIWLVIFLVGLRETKKNIPSLSLHLFSLSLSILSLFLSYSLHHHHPIVSLSLFTGPPPS